MIGLLILAQEDIGKGLIRSATHMLGKKPPQLEALAVKYGQLPEELSGMIENYINKVNRGYGVLILADIYGATHTNTACRFLKKDHIEMVTGVNVPMLVRVLNYRNLSLDELIDKAITGGNEGTIHATDSFHTMKSRK